MQWTWQKRFTLIASALFLLVNSTKAQVAPRIYDTVTNYSEYKRALTFSALLQTRFVYSATPGVDINGKHFSNTAETPINNSFLVKRARFMSRASINDHFSANFMINFAEFSGNPTGKVLENAFIKYSLNKHFNLQAGQFRPFFGIEDAVAVDLIRTLDYSNQYYAFGANGWQSFQVGLTALGMINSNDKRALKYYAGVYNGNNRNQPADNDNTKNVYLRMEKMLNDHLTIGANAALGSMATSTGKAYGADFLAQVTLAPKWKLFLMGEYKYGNNFNAYHADSVLNKRLSQYQMNGFYLFPILQFAYASPRFRAIEFSARYEWFRESARINPNPRQTVIPNLSFIFADNFFAALQIGTSIDLYKRKIPQTTSFNHTLLYAQLQCRF